MDRFALQVMRFFKCELILLLFFGFALQLFLSHSVGIFGVFWSFPFQDRFEAFILIFVFFFFPANLIELLVQGLSLHSEVLVFLGQFDQLLVGIGLGTLFLDFFPFHSCRSEFNLFILDINKVQFGSSSRSSSLFRICSLFSWKGQSGPLED